MTTYTLSCLTFRLAGVSHRAAVRVGLHVVVGLDADTRTDPRGGPTGQVTTSGRTPGRYPDRPLSRVFPIGVYG
jgi:hypothetical protein